MRTLLIDNHDSFTYNLFQYLAASNGVAPLVVRNDEMSWDAACRLGFDNIVISPGPGRPQRREDLGISADALAHAEVPILGVCLGHQAMGHACGATVDLARRPMHGRVDSIAHDGQGLFRGIPSPFEAVRYHSLAVTHLPAELEALAWAPDGTLMALRHRDKPWWGVQFHPESICSEYGARLLRNFRDLSANWLRSRVPPERSSSFVQGAGRGATPPSSQWELNARCIDCFVEPEDAYPSLFADQRPAFWLDSSQNGPGVARFSYMGDAGGPYSEALRYDSANTSLHIKSAQSDETRRQSILDYLRRRVVASSVSSSSPVPFDFAGGFVGYFGYEFRGNFQEAAAHTSSLPDAAGLFVDRFLAFDHQEAQIWIVSLKPTGGPDLHRSWTDEMARKLHAASTSDARAQTSDFAAAQLGEMKWRTPLPAYRSQIAQCQQEIRQGESYEICLTNQLVGRGHVDALPVYFSLRQHSPAPYAAFLALPEVAVLSASPELFLRIQPDRTVESKPIKGTAPRGRTPAEDEQVRVDLQADEKTRSENLMIVDLLRNDLSRCCEVGSVHVPLLFAIESYSTVHQMVSTVRGTLRAGLSVVDALQSAFPGGSMTGAPKKRTLRIIDQLEGGPRGIYSGSLGYLSLNGTACLNVVIRTLVVENDRVSIGAGGAIVAMSDPDAEVDEIVLKARALWNTLKASGAPLNASDLEGDLSGGRIAPA